MSLKPDPSQHHSQPQVLAPVTFQLHPQSHQCQRPEWCVAPGKILPPGLHPCAAWWKPCPWAAWWKLCLWAAWWCCSWGVLHTCHKERVVAHCRLTKLWPRRPPRHQAFPSNHAQWSVARVHHNEMPKTATAEEHVRMPYRGTRLNHKWSSVHHPTQIDLQRCRHYNYTRLNGLQRQHQGCSSATSAAATSSVTPHLKSACSDILQQRLYCRTCDQPTKLPTSLNNGEAIDNRPIVTRQACG